jgi:hypothetical protein
LLDFNNGGEAAIVKHRPTERPIHLCLGLSHYLRFRRKSENMARGF